MAGYDESSINAAPEMQVKQSLKILDKVPTSSARFFRETERVLRDGTSFTNELKKLLNRYSEENGSNTPDFILANYLVNCLDTFNAAINAREKLCGR